MLVSETLVETTIFVPIKKIDEALTAIASSGYFHPELYYKKLPGETEFTDRLLYRSLEEKLSKIANYVKVLDVELPPPEFSAIGFGKNFLKESVAWRDVAEKTLSEFSVLEKEFDTGVKLILEAEALIRDIEHKLESLMPFASLEIDLDMLKNAKNFEISVGLLPAESYPLLSKILEEKKDKALLVYMPSPVEGAYIIMVIVKPGCLDEIISALRHIGYRVLAIPEGLPPVPSKAVMRLQHQIQEIEAKKEKIRKGLLGRMGELFNYYSLLYCAKEVYRIVVNSRKTEHTVVIQGYIPYKKQREFSSRLKKALSNAFLLLYGRRIRGSEETKAPTLVEIPRMLKPFHMITEMYGTPRYGEIVPTIFIAITFPLMFGLMFPDAGHGLAILLAGLLYYHRSRFNESRRNFGLLLVYLGIASIITGFLAGEFFGPMTGLTKLWEHIGIKPPYASPLHAVEEGLSPEVLLKFSMLVALRVGVFTLALGCLLGLVDSVMLGEYEKALTTRLGKFLVFFLAAIPFFAGRTLDDVGSLLSQIALGGGQASLLALAIRYGILLSFLYLLVSEPILVAMREGLSEMKHAMGEAFLEFFETVLMLIGNTASFLRIMGLSLAHSGLMFGFTIIAESVLGPSIPLVLAAGIVYAIGNIMTMALEALIVFAHTLRLHFYEWFSKFYLATGIKFEPVRAPIIATM